MRMKWLPLIAACAVTAGAADLFHDDFSHFPPGWLTNPVGTLNAAIQEYHYLPHRGVPLGAWASPIGHLDAWIVGDERGVPYLEEQLDSTAKQWSPPLFITGDGEWSDYAVEASVKLLSLKDAAGWCSAITPTGITTCFRWAAGRRRGWSGTKCSNPRCGSTAGSNWPARAFLTTRLL